MTVKELEERVRELEQKVRDLEAKVDKPSLNPDHPNPYGPWWREGAGRFAGDPVFEEIVRLGKEYRESTRPGYKKRKRRKAAKKNARS